MSIQEQIGEILAEHKRQILEITFQRQTEFESKIERRLEQMSEELSQITQAYSTYLQECKDEDAAIPPIQKDLQNFGSQLDAIWQTFLKAS